MLTPSRKIGVLACLALASMAAVQQPIQPHLWARLARVPDENG